MQLNNSHRSGIEVGGAVCTSAVGENAEKNGERGISESMEVDHPRTIRISVNEGCEWTGILGASIAIGLISNLV